MGDPEEEMDEVEDFDLDEDLTQIEEIAANGEWVATSRYDE